MKSKSIKNNKVLLFLFAFTFFSQLSFCQLANFSLTVTKTDETCTGNGALNFNVTGITAGATVLYSIYILPNITTPLAVLSSNSITGLNSGNYRVVALQSLGNLSNTQQQDVLINDQIIPLVYGVTTTNIPACGGTGSITVNIIQGTSLTYEIISGPILFGVQTSNVFSNLSIGNYNIRVKDACGEGVVQAVTLIREAPTPNLVIKEMKNVCQIISDCDTIVNGFPISATIGTIVYPLTVEITVFPPNNAVPILLTQIIASDDSESIFVLVEMPFYNNILFTYSIKVTDGCNNIYTLNNQQLNNKISLGLDDSFRCFKRIDLGVCNYSPPFTVEFVSSPVGFIPSNFNSAHPINSSSYVSTEGNEMPDGIYIIQITDSCGRTAQSQIDLKNKKTDYELIPVNDSCSNSSIIYIKPLTNIKPLGIVTVIINSAPLEFNHALPYDASSTIVDGRVAIELVPGSYIIDGIDVCGRPYHFEVEVLPSHVRSVIALTSPQFDCELINGTIILQSANAVFIDSILITEAPSSYNHTLPYLIPEFSFTPDDQGNNVYIISGLPFGDYTIVVSVCGTIYNYILNVPLSISANVYGSQLKGCEIGYGSILLSSVIGGLTSFIITAAPATFTETLPFDVSSNIANYIYRSGALPEGTYTFHHTNSCNVEGDSTYFIAGYQVLENTIDVQGNCGSFNLFLNHSVNESQSHSYWLQKFNATTNQWMHPITNVQYLQGSTPSNSNSLQLTNGTFNYNIASLGKFRILKYHIILSPSPDCFSVIKEFEFTGEIKIISANTIQCNNGNSEIFITSEGIAPLNYRITTKNGQPFIVENGNSNSFSGLVPGIYNFQVIDFCGNIANRVFDITTLQEPIITASHLCEGQVGQLFMQPISFLNYQWWKGTDTTTILSTTNVLTFNPFSQTTNPGIYYVHIFSTSTLSCIDKIISFTVPAISNPNAGQDGVTTICQSTNPINLYPLLVGNYDPNGTWEETTSSGGLVGNIWTPTSGLFGEFKFKYRVNGFCDDFDEAIVKIHYNPNPPVPIISMQQDFCPGDAITFIVGNITDATYNWSGPNGFVATIQNPILENCSSLNAGVYTVKAIVNECESTSTIAINIKPIPVFSIESGCVFNSYLLNVIPVPNSFIATNATYSWTGPNGFNSSQNPVNITNLALGEYNVVVTNQECASQSQAIQVTQSLCIIPQGISPGTDGANDELDLRGFGEILQFKIYSRYGRIVFEQNNYTNQWHGQDYKNRDLPDATYYYYIKFKTGEEKTGWVYVNRE